MIINIINNKGGTGKTTTSVNLAAALARAGNRVLLVDLDSQSSASISLGFRGQSVKATIADILFNDMPIDSAICDSDVENLSLVPGDMALANGDLLLSGVAGREKLLMKSIGPVRDEYDYILFDSPPSLSVIFVNSLTASDYFIVPIVPEYLALEGLINLMRVIKEIKSGIHCDIKMLGVLFTMVNPRLKMNRKVTKEIIDVVKEEYGDLVFKTMIVRSPMLSEAPAVGGTIFDYAPHSTGARHYTSLAREVMKRSSAYAS